MNSNSDSDSEELYDIVTGNDQTPVFDYIDPYLTNPMVKAIEQRDNNTFYILLHKKKNLNNVDNNGNTPLHLAVIREDEAMLKLLLARSNVRKDCKNFIGDTPLMISVKRGLHSITYHLLSSTNCINIANNFGSTPLHIAITNGHSDFMILDLIKRGANINAQDGNNYTPLHCAVERHRLETVCMLLYYGADVSLSCLSNLTPFMHAANDRAKFDIAQALIQYYDDFSQCTVDGYDALLLAANSRNLIAVDIIRAGADVNCVTPEGYDLLFFPFPYGPNLFKLVLSKIEHKILLERPIPFLKSFIAISQEFTTSEWLECMYIILELPIIVDLITHCLDFDYYFSIIQYLLNCFACKLVVPEDRLKILYGVLSFGAESHPDDIEGIYYAFGMKEEFNACIQSVNMNKPCKSNFARYILGTEANATSLYKNMCTCRELFVPRLRELARDQTREYIRQRGNIKEPYQFYDFIKNLEIPGVIRDMILCKGHFFYHKYD